MDVTEKCITIIFLSTPSVRRATEGKPPGGQLEDISIHALREEGDSYQRGGALFERYFYPRPP